MSDPSVPSELEKRSTETTASTPLKFSVLRLALAFVLAGASDVIGVAIADATGGAKDCGELRPQQSFPTRKRVSRPDGLGVLADHQRLNRCSR
jgi:hypothetical protein